MEPGCAKAMRQIVPYNRWPEKITVEGARATRGKSAANSGWNPDLAEALLSQEELLELGCEQGILRNSASDPRNNQSRDDKGSDSGVGGRGEGQVQRRPDLL